MHPATSGTLNDETGAMLRLFHYLLFYCSKDSPSGQINLMKKPEPRNTGIGAMRLARKSNQTNTAWCRRKREAMEQSARRRMPPSPGARRHAPRSKMDRSAHHDPRLAPLRHRNPSGRFGARAGAAWGTGRRGVYGLPAGGKCRLQAQRRRAHVADRFEARRFPDDHFRDPGNCMMGRHPFDAACSPDTHRTMSAQVGQIIKDRRRHRWNRSGLCFRQRRRIGHRSSRPPLRHERIQPVCRQLALCKRTAHRFMGTQH